MPLLRADVEGEYFKDENLKKEDVEALKFWAETQPHLPSLNDVLVIMFLKKCHYDRQAAKKRIDDYLTIRTLCRDLFTGLDPFSPGIHRIMKTSFQEMLPKTTPDGYRIFFIKILDPNPENFVHKDLVRYMNMVGELFMEQVGCADGILALLDEENFGFEHLTKTDFSLVKKYLYITRVGLPIRIKATHVINPSTFTDKAMVMLKPVMTPKMIKSFRIHKKLDDLYQYIPRECLPDEYGGSVGTIAELRDKQMRNFEDNASFFASLDETVVDESKRTGKTKFPDDVFGIEGTFKKLEID